MDVDTNTGRGEQVTEHYLPGAGTDYERKKYRKKKKVQKTTGKTIET